MEQVGTSIYYPPIKILIQMGRNRTWLGRWRIEIQEEEKTEELLENASVHLYEELNNTVARSYFFHISIFPYIYSLL